jgi:hypothetical protein
MTSRQVSQLRDKGSSAVERSCFSGGTEENVQNPALLRCVKKFFATPHIDKMLSYLKNRKVKVDEKVYSGIVGWEKWLQFEFLHFLDTAACFAEVLHECTYTRDGRYQSGKSCNILDMACRPMQQENDLYIGIELKVGHSPEYAVKSLLKDITGILHIKDQEWDLNGVFALALMKNYSDKSKYKMLIDTMGWSCFETGGWTCVVAAWQPTETADTRKIREGYKKFCFDLKEKMEACNIEL